jgi:hypothetical protein
MQNKKNIEKIVVVKPKNFNKRKAFCGICDSILTTSLDIIASDEYDCCERCRIKWVEPRKEAYKEGWRPSEDEVLEEIKKRKALPLSFMI